MKKNSRFCCILPNLSTSIATCTTYSLRLTLVGSNSKCNTKNRIWYWFFFAVHSYVLINFFFLNKNNCSICTDTFQVAFHR